MVSVPIRYLERGRDRLALRTYPGAGGRTALLLSGTAMNHFRLPRAAGPLTDRLLAFADSL